MPTIPRLHSLPFDLPSAEGLLAHFRFIVLIAAGSAGSNGCIAWMKRASGQMTRIIREVVTDSSASSYSVETSQVAISGATCFGFCFFSRWAGYYCPIVVSRLTLQQRSGGVMFVAEPDEIWTAPCLQQAPRP
jgi:hypothetical protein